MNASLTRHICLVHPEIPQNTGSIGRLAAATRTKLHLIEPLGFSLSDRYLKRAGLDYWPFLDFQVHENFDAMLQTFSTAPRMAFFSTKATKLLWDLPPVDILVFGRETAGLPSLLRERYEDNFYKIPMSHPGVRSLNLANAVSIALYQQLRPQEQGRGLEETAQLVPPRNPMRPV